MAGRNTEFKAAIILICCSTLAGAADLKPETLDAWHDYVRSANERLQQSLRPRNLFMEADEFSGICARLRAGEVFVTPTVAPTPKRVPNGLIHDWTAAAFIPGVRVEDVLRVLRSYDEYKQIYKSTVIESRQLRSRDGDDFSMILRNRAILSHTAVAGDYHAVYKQLDEKRWYSILHATRIQEIENYGKPDEDRLDVGMGTGYIWRVYTIGKFEERDGGVYVEIEGIALSRDVPGSLRWMVDPLIRRISRSTLTSFLCTTRDSVMANLQAGGGHSPDTAVGSAFRKR